ncbi:hypothetical protein [Streptomyces sp. H27-D2]|uniref:hypothetical protein n=1 Tax=Streptomyces sp. H27-D2 TaxID=3046304 RepID=UPI002DB9B531|nr:hypothetical protein [Streptomyces sp. H27-D2]MEC4016977.1 hypothetical protein [Streptomyces sp. H27-D2]
MMNDVPEGGKGGPVPGAPRDYVDFLKLANGAIFGRIVVFDAKTVGDMQFYADPTEGTPVQLGREEWFCFGKVNDDPLFIRRTDSSVWGFRDMGALWWQSEIFESLEDGLDSFVRGKAFGDGYLSFTSAEADDPWWQVLRHIGRVT